MVLAHQFIDSERPGTGTRQLAGTNPEQATLGVGGNGCNCPAQAVRIGRVVQQSGLHGANHVNRAT